MINSIHITSERNKSDRAGFALLVVVLIVAVLSAMVMEFLFGVKLQAELLANHTNGMKSRYIGRSGYNAYKYILEANLLSPSSSQNLLALSSWVGFGSGIEGIVSKEDAATMMGTSSSYLDPDPNGPYRGQWSISLPANLFALDGPMYGRMINERGKMNLNAIITPNLTDRNEDVVNKKNYNRLLELFVLLDIEETDARICLDGVVDWIDGNAGAEPRGAEDDFYRSRKDHQYYARNDFLLSVDEMRLINGCNADIVEKVKDFVTVYPRTGADGSGSPDNRIDAVTASKVVLTALFLAAPEDGGSSPNGQDVAAAVAEDIYTKALEKSGLSVSVTDSGQVSASGPTLLNAAEVQEVIGGRLKGDFDLYNYSDSDQQYYQIRAGGDTNGAQGGIEAIVRKGVQGIEVLFWREE